jgi:hypothetical protein
MAQNKQTASDGILDTPDHAAGRNPYYAPPTK